MNTNPSPNPFTPGSEWFINYGAGLERIKIIAVDGARVAWSSISGLVGGTCDASNLLNGYHHAVVAPPRLPWWKQVWENLRA